MTYYLTTIGGGVFFNKVYRFNITFVLTQDYYSFKYSDISMFRMSKL